MHSKTFRIPLFLKTILFWCVLIKFDFRLVCGFCTMARTKQVVRSEETARGLPPDIREPVSNAGVKQPKGEFWLSSILYLNFINQIFLLLIIFSFFKLQNLAATNLELQLCVRSGRFKRVVNYSYSRLRSESWFVKFFRPRIQSIG